MITRATFFAAALAVRQHRPRPAGAARGAGRSATAPVVSPGLTPALAEAVTMIRDGQYVTAMAKIDDVLAQDARNPQARFLKGVVQTDQEELDDAAVTFTALTEDFPELPEPHNNLAVIWAQQGQYDKAKTELEIALKAQPDYAIAHENLGDVYTRLAGAEYDRAVVLDKTNKSAQAKLALVRELYAVAPSSTAPKPVIAQAGEDQTDHPGQAQVTASRFRHSSHTKELSMFHRNAMLLTLLFAAAIAAPAKAANPQVDLDTSAGKIRIELFPDAAPKTVENFLAYVKSKQFDDTQFHRVIPGFMIQGGGFTADFKQKPTPRPPVQNEAEMSSKAGLLERAGHRGHGTHERSAFRQRRNSSSTSPTTSS